MPTRLLTLATALLIGATTPNAAQQKLTSKFFSGHPCATAITAGKPYDMNVPNWIVKNNQNRDICAYKFFAALHMLGYNTSRAPGVEPHLRVLRKFKNDTGLPPGNLVTVDVLVKLDARVAALEPKLATLAAAFPLKSQMLPLHPNDISQDALAALYALAMSVMPAELQMATPELLHCIDGQCLGELLTPNGSDLPKKYTPGTDYRFADLYFHPTKPMSQLPPAATIVGTILHEFAHYIDGRGLKTAFKAQSSVNMEKFIPVNYKYDKASDPCFVKQTTDPQDWVTWYGFTDPQPCPAGKNGASEEWAEAFSMYVTSGKAFRAAGNTRTMTIGRKYNQLRDLFHGVEFDTDLIREPDSGCIDVVGQTNPKPGYASCSLDYVWKWTRPVK